MKLNFLNLKHLSPYDLLIWSVNIFILHTQYFWNGRPYFSHVFYGPYGRENTKNTCFITLGIFIVTTLIHIKILKISEMDTIGSRMSGYLLPFLNSYVTHSNLSQQAVEVYAFYCLAICCSAHILIFKGVKSREWKGR